ncbi:MAG TPA: ABC transporter permease, partial [Puia sp.]|nr:ABC transporter permease [Puia sp.]
MLENYFKTAWRNLFKSKWYSVINIFGLSIGMAVTLLIGLWIRDEVSFNKSFENYGQLSRVMENSTNAGETNSYSYLPIPLSVELRTKYHDDFKKVAMTYWTNSYALAPGEKKLIANGIYTEQDLPEMLTLNMVAGSKTGLRDPTAILLSQSLAKTIFGNEDPINKVIRLDNKIDLKVSGVFTDLPFNSDFKEIKFMASWQAYVNTNSWVRRSLQDWDDNSWQIIVQLADHSNPEKVSAKIRNSLTGHERKDKPEVFIHPMSKWHLFSEFKNGKNVGGNIQYVWLFGSIGFFVLLLACINFMNLSTARSEKRAKEVGIRKAVGSQRKQLVIQFFSESLLIAFISLAIAIILTKSGLPWFNILADKQMIIPWTNVYLWLYVVGFTLFTGLISGSYPALFLSSFNPVKVLKGSFKMGRLASIPRKILVVLQFTISISLIVGTIIIFEQIQFARNRPIGYSREGLITINMRTPDLYGHYDALKNDLINTGTVENMSESSSPVTDVWSNQSGFDWKGKDPNIVPSFAVIGITHEFGKTIGWQFKEGRDFSRDFSTDTSSMILNEAAARYMGFKDPVGETVIRPYRNIQKYKVIGVVRNMLMESPFDPVKPTIFMLDYEWANVITIKVSPKVSLDAALPKIAEVFSKYNPKSPFDYSFADEVSAKKFELEERVGKLATFFAVLAIFVSCMGLFGLASFVAEQRTKELAVRKILGASPFNLWRLLSKEFFLLVSISLYIAIP